MSKLTIQNLTKTFDGNFYASKNISFTAEQGEFVTLLGPSGCGKTTLLKMIAGFHTPDSGEIRIADQVINDIPPEKRNTSMCFQSYALFPHLSVSHNIAFGLKQKKIPLAEQKQRVQEALDQVGLNEHAHKMPAQLSGGQQQRVALARAMVNRPDVILFDEPLSNLDAKLRESVRFEIKELQHRYNLTAIYVTHDQAEALAMSDKIVVLNKGCVEQIGTPEEIYYSPANSFVADFIGAANITEATVLPAEDDGFYDVSCSLGDFRIKSDKAPAADRINVFWRPEDAEIARPGDTNTFTLKIDKFAFLGNMTDLFARLETSNELIRVQLPKKPAFDENNTVTFKMPENGIRFLEKVNP
ncbi:ABC transporter ATP-binding protein [Endozoicomonas ascidiicola]|uniref:ABC transporter ATP-binding protein n=1 Tax=Endozoicomonas ascidiicola TaxID=1698521 RepID=UPI000829E0DE|nr:ABC transporter ATP-binding protein [Endozoicomonas ascidiicola]